MRVLVCGGRHYNDSVMVWKLLYDLKELRGISCIIQGGASGADRLAARWAKEAGVQCVEYTAQWEALGKKAGPLRNQRMLDEGKPDLVIAFPGGRGTADMTARARKSGVHVHEVEGHAHRE